MSSTYEELGIGVVGVQIEKKLPYFPRIWEAMGSKPLRGPGDSRPRAPRPLSFLDGDISSAPPWAHSSQRRDDMSPPFVL